MKRFYSKFRIGLMTFALGLASVFVFKGTVQLSDEIPVDLPQVQSSEVFEIITKENWKGFVFVGHGCGGRNKYGAESSVTGYRTSDWKYVSVYNSGYETKKDAEKEILLRINEASKIIEYKKHKIILEYQEGKVKRIDLIKYDGRTGIEVVSSNSLELITEFEKREEIENRN